MSQDPSKSEPRVLVESRDLRRVLAEAQSAAWEREHSRVSPFHILYAIFTEEEDNLAAVIMRSVLQWTNQDIIDLMQPLQMKLSYEDTPPQSIEIPHDHSTVLVLMYARDKAATQGDLEIGCDHLMFGIYHVGGETERLLRSKGITEVEFKKELNRIYPNAKKK